MLDFSDVLERALELLRQMDEFSQSRFRLESRYHHVLVDEFQDTSRAQWELVALLVQSWGEGLGRRPPHPSIFIVGDRKQSIYRFRDAESAVLHEAARHIQALRPAGNPRRSITQELPGAADAARLRQRAVRRDGGPGPGGGRFTYTEDDRFPTAAADDGQATDEHGSARRTDDTVDPDLRRTPRTSRTLGSRGGDGLDVVSLASRRRRSGGVRGMVADEIARILREDSVRDRKTGVPRRAVPGDIGVLFRSRASHREFERELERRGIPAYVYKGLGFFDADETKDAMALIRFLADPASDLRAAAFLRSRFVRLSDAALATLAPRLAEAVLDFPTRPGRIERRTRISRRGSTPSTTRTSACWRSRGAYVPGWLAQVDRVPPAELFETHPGRQRLRLRARAGRGSGRPGRT